MKSLVHYAIVAFTALSFIAACTDGSKPKQPLGPIGEAAAVDLAKRAFAKTGRRLEDYNVTVDGRESAAVWTIWFERKGLPAGGTDFVRIDKLSGKLTLYPGE